MTFPWFTLVVCILVLVLIITAGLAIIYFDRRQECYRYISPWCYRWECLSTTEPVQYNPTDAFLRVIEACKPVDGKPSSQCVCAWQNFYDPAGENTCTSV